MAEQIDGKDGIGDETEGRSCAFPRSSAAGSDADGCYVGIMSGTSMDGADAAACYFDGATMTMVARASEPFSKRLRRALLDAQNAEGPDALRRCGLLKVSLTRAYVAVARKLLGLPEMKGVPIAAIGCHGQTITHKPADGYTIQLCDWGMLAQLTGCDAVGDFRGADLALGGVGAPLAPAFHAIVFAHPTQTRAALNVGGVGNLTVIRPNCPVRGWDCGPGNTLMDLWAQTSLDRPYDNSGMIAREGKVDEAALNRLLAHPYFAAPPPKSASREDFPLSWALSCMSPGSDVPTTMRTFLELTAVSAANAIKGAAPDAAKVAVCGGGAKNGLLMERLAQLLAPARVVASDEMGVPADAVEACCMAWYASMRARRIPVDLTSVTGQKRPAILGGLWAGRWAAREPSAFSPIGRPPPKKKAPNRSIAGEPKIWRIMLCF